MKKEQVLIVEDDADIRDGCGFYSRVKDMLLWKRKMEDRGFIV